MRQEGHGLHLTLLACVSQVCDNGISHIQWHPSSERLIVAAADKSGNLGLWDVDHDSTIAREFSPFPPCQASKQISS